jgi:hypothetical protein
VPCRAMVFHGFPWFAVVCRGLHGTENRGTAWHGRALHGEHSNDVRRSTYILFTNRFLLLGLAQKCSEL